MPSITTLAPILHHHLTITATEAAHAAGCVQRVRRFSGATLVQTLVLGFLEAPDATLSELCQLAAVRGVSTSPQGLAYRFTPELAATLQSILAAIVREVVVGSEVAIPLLQRFGHVWVLDTTTITLPDELAGLWAGCGGNPGQGLAGLKVALEVDLVTGQMRGPSLQDGRVPDRGSPLCSRPHPVGSLTVRDLGFFRLDSFQEAQARGEHWLSRLMARTIVFTADGQRWTQTELLKAHPGPTLDLPVTLGGNARIPARLLAVRVPAAVAETRRKRLHREAQKKGQRVSAERLTLADWTVLATDLSPQDLTVEEALALLRARWQVEQLFDLWKTHGGLDRCRSKHPWRVLSEVYAKLIALVIQHWLLLHGDWEAPNHSLVKAARVVRKSVRLLADAIDRIGRLRRVLKTIGRLLGQAGRLNARGKHPNTYQRLLDPVGTGLT